MINYFITKKEVTKVSILQTILTAKKRVFLKDIMTNYNISKNTALRHIDELEKDISIVFSNLKLIIDKDNNYCLTSKKSEDNAFIINKMKEYYIQNSSLFLTFKEVIQSDKSIIKIANTLNFSASTVYSKIAILNKVTQPFNVEINFFQNGRFKGDESSIRFFLYKMILFENKINKDNPFGPKVPIEFLNLDNIKNNLVSVEYLSASQIMRLKMIQGITLYRINFQNEFLAINKNLLNDILYFQSSDFNLNCNTQISQNRLKNESKLFCFIIRAAIYDIDTFEKKEEIVRCYQQSELDIARNTEFILNYFSESTNFHFTEYSYIISYYLLLINLICLKYVNFDLSVLFENNSELTDRYSLATDSFKNNENKIKELLTNDVLCLSLPHFSKEKLTELQYILRFIYDINTKPKQTNIFIQFTENIHSGDLVHHCLTSTFSPESIAFVHNPNEADIIISDAYEGDTSKAKRFHFENIYNQQQWKNLLQFITNSIYDNSFFREIE